jgi:hypothetical protein
MVRWSGVLAIRERQEDLLREAEQARLIRAAKGPGNSKDRQLSVMLVLSSLLGLFIRPQR